MTIRIVPWRQLNAAERQRILARSESDVASVLEIAREIVDDVSANGDAAIRRLSARLDRFDTPGLPLRVRESEIDTAVAGLAKPVIEALDYAIANVRAVHSHQAPQPLVLTEPSPGILAGERTTPIDAVGLYVPRGRGSFPSMLYMLAVPAAVAGVKRVVVTTPPSPDGTIDAACLYAARACGVHEIYRVGGAQAVAALAVGTESIEPVDKIVGPGSAYVAAAKRVLRDRVDVGIPAGPSESMILADESATAASLAVDLLIEAEHGADSQALLVTTSEPLAREVADRLSGLINETPKPRRAFLEQVFGSYGMVILAEDMQEATEIVNAVAPEHLQIRTRDPFATMASVRNAGEILLGEHSAFSLANYAAGANAVLPTGGFARTWSGVSVSDFTKRTSVVRVSNNAYPEIARHVAVLGEYEGFYWHHRALSELDRQ
ncbi:MAG: histidinol dehydrogenase [Spirochaetales bacterium]